MIEAQEENGLSTVWSALLPLLFGTGPEEGVSSNQSDLCLLSCSHYNPHLEDIHFRAWRWAPVILISRRLRQEDHEFEGSLGSIVRPA